MEKKKTLRNLNVSTQNKKKSSRSKEYKIYFFNKLWLSMKHKEKDDNEKHGEKGWADYRGLVLRSINDDKIFVRFLPIDLIHHLYL